AIEEDIPTPKAGEVRVKVLAAGVSLPDVLAREGVHPETPRVPYTPGWDLVGTVDQLGQSVTGFEVGQTVAAMPIHGCYAQYACVPSRKLVPVPVTLITRGRIPPVPDNAKRRNSLAAVRSPLGDSMKSIDGGMGSPETLRKLPLLL